MGEMPQQESGGRNAQPLAQSATTVTKTSLPFPAREANREKLQQYLLDYYASSTFNTCEHQILPLMDGPPMRLMINPDAIPTAHHSPIPVPLH